MDISIKMLGELAVFHNDKPVNLPPSKRTRALLAYLAMTNRPHRRDRLCEIFWEIPDDPRGALRWSLSKLRPIVNESQLERLVTDRERVSLLTNDIQIDLWTISQQAEDPNLPIAELKSICGQLKDPFLEGTELPNQDIFQQWLTSERLEVERIRVKILARLSSHPDAAPDEQLNWAQEWEALDPYNPEAATQLLTKLERLGRSHEALELQHKLIKRFRNAGISWNPEARTNNSKENETSKNSDTEADKNRLEDKPVTPKRELLARQKIQFCTARDGVRIAYATIGEGFPIVKAANWLSHLEHDWDSPIWSPLFRELAHDHHVIRYDERGNGLSDWDVSSLTFESFVEDLETVVEASKMDKFALLGISQGAAVSIEYAIRHPERVTHLILFGGYAAGWRIGATEQTIKEREAIMTLTETGWGQNNPAYRQIFSSTFMPSANASEFAWFNEFQRLTTSPDNAVRFLSVFGDIDVREQLSKVTVPTLVIHSLGDQRIPVNVGRDIAATIPDAEFVGLESDGHLLLGREPASKDFVEAVREFIART